MKKLEIDFKIHSTKQKLFDYLMLQIEGLFGANYDALIDALIFYRTPLLLQLSHISSYEEKENLLEVFKIIQKENSLILFNGL